MASRGYVVDTSHSPHAALRPVPLERVRIEGGFWHPWLERTVTVTLPSQYDQLERTGVVDNFRKAAGKMPGTFRGLLFNDTDAYKWIEAVSFSLAGSRDAGLQRTLDALIETVAAAQDADGYLDTYFSFGNRQERWTGLGVNHEMYCAGHLIQAAVAHHRATGEHALLDVARRCADHVDGTFGPGRRPGAPGHPEIEMALVELYRLTGEQRYLALAGHLIDQRGRVELTGLPAEKIVNHVPFREQTEISGHAVRALYLACGATDVLMETGEEGLRSTLERLWRSLVGRRMHVTGGAGSRFEGETFGDDHELPNRRAYCETCAAIGSFMWNWRMLLASGEARHADLMELALHNGILSGISLDGVRYFYVNPLADRGLHRRAEWIECACCIPNLSRTFLSLPGCLFSVSDDGIQVHLYAAARAEIPLGDSTVRVDAATRYPWDGEVRFTISTERETPFAVSFRVPEWAGRIAVSVNGKRVESPVANGYTRIGRRWRGRTEVSIRLPMKVRLLASHPHVLDNHGRIAIQRGPVVYCVEQADNPGFDPWDLAIATDSPLEASHRDDLLGGVTVVEGRGVSLDHRAFGDSLYRPVPIRGMRRREVRFTAVPYFAWANREPGPMTVWIAEKLP